MTRMEDKEEEEHVAAVSCQTNCIVTSGGKYCGSYLFCIREITVPVIAVEETKTVRRHLLDR